MNERDDRETRAGGGVSDRGTATVSEPAQDFVGNAHATQSIQASDERHLTRRQLENVRSLKKTRKRLAVLAVADEAEAGGRRNRAGDAAHMTTTASHRHIDHFYIFHWLQAGYWNERDITILLKNNVRFWG